MTAVFNFLSRTHGKNRLSFVDWIAYAYLLLGFLIIFLPVLWLLLNSVKSQFLLQKLDTNVLPLDYDRVVRATVFGPEGKEIFIMKDLPSGLSLYILVSTICGILQQSFVMKSTA